MRNLKAWQGLALLAALAGCNPDGGGRINFVRNGGVSPPTIAPPPTAADLVYYLNTNSQKIPGVRADDVSLTCQQGFGPAITLDGKLCCQGPRKFRMSGNLFGGQEVDLGSNDQEFWYWIKRADPPYQYYCSYQAMQEGKVKHLPFPFQPSWVLEAMGMGHYGPPENYVLKYDDKSLRLTERTMSAQGQPVNKVIVFRRLEAKGNQPQITDFLLLEEATGKEICSCHITERLIIPNSGGEIPRRFELRWPEQKLKLTLQLDRVAPTGQFSQITFTRMPLTNVPSLNLATWTIDPGVQRAGMGGVPPRQ